MLILSALSRFHVLCSTQVYDDNGLWNRRSKKLKSDFNVANMNQINKTMQLHTVLDTWQMNLHILLSQRLILVRYRHLWKIIFHFSRSIEENLDYEFVSNFIFLTFVARIFFLQIGAKLSKIFLSCRKKNSRRWKIFGDLFRSETEKPKTENSTENRKRFQLDRKDTLNKKNVIPNQNSVQFFCRNLRQTFRIVLTLILNCWTCRFTKTQC